MVKIHYYKGIIPIEVDEKLRAASYFLNKIKKLKNKHKNLALADPMELCCLLDGFLFEIIGAKDAFLHHLNHISNYLLEDWQVNEKRLLQELKKQEPSSQKLLNIVNEITDLKEKKDSWLWRLNNYRNISAHRLLLKRYVKFRGEGKISKNKTTEIRITHPMKFLSGDMFYFSLTPMKSNFKKHIIKLSPQEVFLLENPEEYCKKEEGPPGEPHKQEIISYCEISLKKMREFLRKLQRELK